MAKYEQRDMSGVLFKNEEKQTPKHADYRGEAKINGEDFWLSAWIKEGKKGKFMSIAIKPKQDAQGKRQGGKQVDDGGDIPF